MRRQKPREEAAEKERNEHSNIISDPEGEGRTLQHLP
jgi:hypothetical protein